MKIKIAHVTLNLCMLNGGFLKPYKFYKSCKFFIILWLTVTETNYRIKSER